MYPAASLGMNHSTVSDGWRDLNRSLFTPMEPPRSCRRWPGAVALKAADDFSSFPCRIRLTNAELVRHCRRIPEGRNRAKYDLNRNRFTCPEINGTEIKARDRVWDKYGLMHSDGWCDGSGEAAWTGVKTPYVNQWHRCTTVFAMIMMGVIPGDVIFDWGSACGHRLATAFQLFGTFGLGLDMQRESVAWANRYSTGQFCHGDGRDLSWIPSESLDGAISFASVFHLNNLDQCVMVTDLVTKLRPGRIAWLGWNGPNIVDPMRSLREGKHMVPAHETWGPCLASANKKLASAGVIGVEIAMMDERDVLAALKDQQQDFTVQLDLSAFSLFIFRQDSKLQWLNQRLGKLAATERINPLFDRAFGTFDGVTVTTIFRQTFDRHDIEVANVDPLSCGPFCGIHEVKDSADEPVNR